MLNAGVMSEWPDELVFGLAGALLTVGDFTDNVESNRESAMAMIGAIGLILRDVEHAAAVRYMNPVAKEIVDMIAPILKEEIA